MTRVQVLLIRTKTARDSLVTRSWTASSTAFGSPGPGHPRKEVLRGGPFHGLLKSFEQTRCCIMGQTNYCKPMFMFF